MCSLAPKLFVDVGEYEHVLTLNQLPRHPSFELIIFTVEHLSTWSSSHVGARQAGWGSSGKLVYAHDCDRGSRGSQSSKTYTCKTPEPSVPHDG